jgi:hypothetical protein
MLDRLNAQLTKRSFRLALLLLLVLEAFSFWGFLFPRFSTVAAITVSLLVLVLAFVRYELAVLAVVAELFVGSQGGYLLTIGLESGLSLSLRMGLFVALLIGWSARSLLSVLRRLRGQADVSGGLDWLDDLRRLKLLWPLLALMAVFAWAGVNGLLRNGFGDAFFDANGYAFFLIWPALLSGLRTVADWSRFVGIWLAAVAVSVLKALFVFYIFSHRMLYAASPLYTWVRDTRVGEITIMTGDFYRIFFQAHLFGLLLVIVAAVFAGYATDWRQRFWRPAVWAIIPVIALVLGLSRSFWFGAFCGAVALAGVLVWARAKWSVWQRLFSVAGLGVITAVMVLAGTYAIPFPKKGAEFSLTGLLGGRVTSLTDDAATSRWELLPKLNAEAMKHPLLGSGFGARVTYRTSDPRVLADSPTGLYSTYAFEWGYQDMWLKLGLLGLAVYGWVLYRLLKPLWATIRANRRHYQAASASPDNHQPLLVLGLWAALIALLATNIFSPYLNHPLGIGTLALLSAAILRLKLVDKPPSDSIDETDS